MSFSLLHFGPKTSKRRTNTHTRANTCTHTQVLLGGPWGRGESALAPLSGKPDLLTSATSDGAAQWRDICVCLCVCSETASQTKSLASGGINAETEEEVRDRQTELETLGPWLLSWQHISKP